MTNHQENPVPRVNVSITGDEANEVEYLRTLLERRLKQRLSIAQVFKRLTKEALRAELEVLKVETDSTSLVLKS